jgi:hypothetical protein
MGIGRETLRKRIARLEQRQQALIGEAIARIQQCTGWSLAEISAEVSRLVAYHQEHGKWPAEISQALQTPPVTQIVLRWQGDDPDPGDASAPASLTPAPEVDEDAELAELLAEVKRRLHAR